MNKLSEAQQRVLEAMRDGAVLERSTIEGSTWLQQFGDGPQWAKCDREAFYSLHDLGYIAGEFRRPASYYRITEAGREALQQSGVGEGEKR